MRNYNEQEPLCLGTDASGIDLEAGYLQVRKGMNCPCDEALNNRAQCPMAFASKNLSSAETRYYNTRRKALGIPHG